MEASLVAAVYPEIEFEARWWCWRWNVVECCCCCCCCVDGGGCSVVVVVDMTVQSQTLVVAGTC